MKYVLLLVLVLLVSCSFTRNPATYNQFQGTQGLVLSFPKGAPPQIVYEDTLFPVKIELHNAGAKNVSFSDMVLTLGWDPLYVSPGVALLEPNPDLYGKGILGRSESYLQGERKLFDVPSDHAFRAKTILGQREIPETELTAAVCYKYATFASATVCIDTSIYQENLRKQSCTQKDVLLSGGQGAPIAVTSIEVQSLPFIGRDGTERIRPQFRIYIEDVGKGYLVGPADLPLKEACVLRNIPREQINSVKLDAQLLKMKLDCRGGMVHLTDGKGEVVCQVRDDDAATFTLTQNYQTVLTINLSYIYKNTVQAPIKIERAFGRTSDVSQPSKYVTGYMYKNDELVKDDQDRPITKCDYYAQNTNEAPEQLRARIDANQPKQFSCACGKERCNELASTLNCFAGLCPGDLFCCTDAPRIPVSTVSPGTEGTPGSLYSFKDQIISTSCAAGVYPSIVAAQFWLESRAGSSSLAQKTNNGFGIRCPTAQSSDTCYKTSGNGYFRIYPSITDSVGEHANRLMGRTSGLSSTITKPFSAAMARKDLYGGLSALEAYAPGQNYPSMLRKVIESNDLRAWDSCMQ